MSKDRKRFNEGDIVYWCSHEGNANYSVKWGKVDEQFYDIVYVDYLSGKETRLVDGVPIEEFQSEQHYRKLPKGWSYDTKLFEITHRDLCNDYLLKIDIKNPNTIKEAYEKGILVKDSTIFNGTIESEITKEGFRIVKKYPIHHRSYVTIYPHRLHYTYEKAKEEVDKNIAEFNRQASLSDYDWSVENIDHDLDRWQKMYSISDIKKNEYRNFLLNLKNVEDVETRLVSGEIQWKYWNKKRWNYIEV